MDLLKFIPIKLTLFLVLGILFGFYLNFDLFLPFFLVLIFLFILGILHFGQKRAKGIYFGVFTMLATISLGMLIVSLSKSKNTPNHYSHQNLLEGSNWRLKITEVLKSTNFSDRYIAKIQQYNNHSVSGRVILSYPKDSLTNKFYVDDELFVSGLAEEIKSPLNPHQFDYKNYLRKLGVYHQLKLTDDNYFLAKKPSPTFIGLAASLRAKIISKLRDAQFGDDEFGIIQALFLGQRNDISETTYTNYKNAGAVHILAVSGLHIGILLLFLQFLLRPLELLPKGKTIKLLVIVSFLWGFAFLAGLSASVVRAVTMFSFVAYAMYLNRPSNTFNILALSMFFILLVNPMLLFDAGFQMSYAAVFAIVWIYPLLQGLWYSKNRFIRYLWQLLSVSIAAQAGVLPISLYYFHQFPGLFFVSNLLIVPFLGLILGLGIVVIALILLNLAPDFLVTFYSSLIGLMNTTIGWVAQQEAFIFKNISFDAVQMSLVYCLFIFLIWTLTKVTFKRVVGLLLCFLGLQLWSIYLQNTISSKERLLVAHQTKNSVVLYQKGSGIHTFATDSIASQRIIADYQIGERIEETKNHALQNFYKIKDENLLIIDSLSTYTGNTIPVDYVLLTQSPKINLERMIDSLSPKLLIADGSNYTNYIKRWKKTCSDKKIPFHYTGEKGACFLLQNKRKRSFKNQ